MAKRKTPAPALPPQSARACWVRFWAWVLGVPLICAGGLGLIAGSLWLMGGQEMMWRTAADMGTALLWIGAILLMYPALLWVWWGELQEGLKAARAWQAMPPEAQAAALAAASPARRRKKG